MNSEEGEMKCAPCSGRAESPYISDESWVLLRSPVQQPSLNTYTATQWYRAHDQRQCWGLQQWGLQRPSARQRRHPWVRIFYKKESWWGKVSNKGPLSWGSFFLFLRFYFFREGKGGRKRGRETSKCGCLSRAPYWGPGPQPKHMPWLGPDPLSRRPALNH